MWLAHVDATPRRGWGAVGGDFNVPCDLLSLLMLRHAGVGVGVGGMLTFHVTCSRCWWYALYTWVFLVRQMTHGKDLKNIPHTLDMSVIKGVKFKTKKTRRSTVRVQKSVQIFKKWSKSSYTCLWTKETMFRNEQAGKWIDAAKKRYAA